MQETLYNMKSYSKNPRQITNKQLSDLEVWLSELGDLSGIVHDLNTDEIISGNMRSKVFDIDSCEIELTEKYDQPDGQGTIARGYIIWQGKKYAYRQVKWTAEQCEKANIVANKAGGSFDFDKLANDFNIENLFEWGFTEFDLGLDSTIDYEKEWEGMPEFDQGDVSSLRAIKVHFATLEDVSKFAELMEQDITEKTIWIWYPKIERAKLIDVECQDES